MASYPSPEYATKEVDLSSEPPLPNSLPELEELRKRNKRLFYLQDQLLCRTLSNKELQEWDRLDEELEEQGYDSTYGALRQRVQAIEKSIQTLKAQLSKKKHADR
jgi:hypothetical protein